MPDLTYAISVAVVNSKLSEKEIIAAIKGAEGKQDPITPAGFDERRKRRYNTREMRPDQTEQTVIASESGD